MTGSVLSSGQAAWLLAKPEDPFGTHLLHPYGRAADSPGAEFEGGPNAKEDAGFQERRGSVHPEFLLGGTKGHEDDIGSRGLNFLQDAAFQLGIFFKAQRRTVGAANEKTGIAFLQFGFGQFGHTRRTTEQIDSQTQTGSLRAKSRHQLGAGHPLR